MKRSYLRLGGAPALQRTRDICTWRAGGLAGLLDPATIVEGHRPVHADGKSLRK